MEPLTIAEWKNHLTPAQEAIWASEVLAIDYAEVANGWKEVAEVLEMAAQRQKKAEGRTAAQEAYKIASTQASRDAQITTWLQGKRHRK